jgi:endo-1,4-beta-xylanase
MNKKLSRRDFLKVAGVTSAGLALSACGVKATEIPTLTPTLTSTILPTLTSTPFPTATSTPKPLTSLRDYADALGIKMGTFIDPGANFWENPDWLSVAAREFNLGVNSIFWHILLPSQGQFDFGLPDAQVGFAVNNKMEVRGEALINPGFLPDWLKKGSFTQEQLISLFQQVIIKVVARYIGKIKTWVVVNEAGFIYQGWDFFEKNIGKDYVDIAFQIARSADPSAKLIYNDYGNESINDVKFQQTKQIANSLSKQSLIDGIGLQMHIEPVAGDPTKFISRSVNSQQIVSIDDLIQGMKQYELPIYITELDVDLRNIKGSDSERFALQASLYGNLMDAIVKSGVCQHISFWGFGDKYSWLEQAQFNGSPLAEPTLFDDELKPKPAYFAVLDVMKKYYSQKI